MNSLFRVEVSLISYDNKDINDSISKFMYEDNLQDVAWKGKGLLRELCNDNGIKLDNVIEEAKNNNAEYEIFIYPYNCDNCKGHTNTIGYFFKAIFTNPNGISYFQRYEIFYDEKSSFNADYRRWEMNDSMKIENVGENTESIRKFHSGDKVRCLFANGIFEIDDDHLDDDIQELVYSATSDHGSILAHESELELAETEEGEE